MLKAMGAEHLPLPRLYRALGEITLNRRLVQLLQHLEPDPAHLLASQDILALIQEAELMGLKLESGQGADILHRLLHRLLRELATACQLEAAATLREFLNLIKRIPITLDLNEAQNVMFDLMQEHFPPLAARGPRDPEALKLAQTLVVVAEQLNFSPVRYFRLLA